MRIFLLGLSFISLLGLAGCTSESGEAPLPGSLILDFEHLVSGRSLELDQFDYLNAHGDTFMVQEFNYYVSNVTLVNSGSGREYLIPESYYLIRKLAGEDSYRVEIPNIPSGSYDALKMSIGIDSEKNTSLDNDGDLNPSNTMAWNWNTGYKFVLLEGKYRTVGGEEGVLVFHIGRDRNYHQMQIQLPSALQINEDAPSVVAFTTDAAEMFQTPYTIDFSVTSDAQFGENADSIAVNYRDMIQVKSVVNGQ